MRRSRRRSRFRFRIKHERGEKNPPGGWRARWNEGDDGQASSCAHGHAVRRERYTIVRAALTRSTKASSASCCDGDKGSSLRRAGAATLPAASWSSTHCCANSGENMSMVLALGGYCNSPLARPMPFHWIGYRAATPPELFTLRAPFYGARRSGRDWAARVCECLILPTSDVTFMLTVCYQTRKFVAKQRHGLPIQPRTGG